MPKRASYHKEEQIIEACEEVLNILCKEYRKKPLENTIAMLESIFDKTELRVGIDLLSLAASEPSWIVLANIAAIRMIEHYRNIRDIPGKCAQTMKAVVELRNRTSLRERAIGHLNIALGVRGLATDDIFAF